jgi:subtilisin family serine protease
MNNFAAWGVTEGTPNLTVAVLDDGVAIDHEDLNANIWRNADEIAGNGIDDDNNGFVDDAMGWDFTDGDSDARPKASDRHGTHVAGIIGADKDNGVGVSGTAPGVTVMPVRWYGGRNGWTTAVITKAVAYAVDNGARILNSSYNIDGWVNDQAIKSALDYVDSKGALFFNSAGNSGANNSARTRLRVPILVGSTIADNTASTDKKSSFSNFGTLVDIFAPGGGGAAGILATVPNNQYARLAGTSMATPNAAASAALIWSAHPDWTKEQVLAQMFATADSLDAQNPTLLRKTGAGRVNNGRALLETAKPPKLDLYREGTDVVVRFPNVFAPGTVNNPAAWTLKNADTGEVIARAANEAYGLNTNQLKFSVAGLPAGNYVFKGSADVLKDPFGQALDGNGDGVAGADAELRFTL